jgi:protoporphyrinogen oxidase
VEPIVILGTGMAAFGAGHALTEQKIPFVAFDSADVPGGHTRTVAYPNGFIFDDGPHISFTRDERVQQVFSDAVDGQYENIQFKVDNYWHGVRMKHPVQMNLHGLPTELIVDVVKDFVASHQRPDDLPIRTYADWLEAAFGTTFAKTFPSVYGLKYHTTTPDNMTTEWLGPRMYRPDLGELLRGAMETVTADVHYVTHFRYPSYGGFYSYLRRFWEANPPMLDHAIKEIDPRARTVSFVDGSVAGYRELISSVPLPELIPLIAGAPREVREAAGRLSFTSVCMVDIGVDRADLSPAQLSYYYDEDIVFPRLNYPHGLSPHVVPPGHGAVQAEIYGSDRYRPFDRPAEAYIEPVIADLHKVGILREGDGIVHRSAHITRYANIIYDLDRAAALAIVHGYLDEIGVRYCGRYGDWNHAWTDEAFTSGATAAERLLTAV